MRTGRKTDEGFTLIEIIVVIAIIAILAGAILITLNPIQATAAKKAAANTRDVLLQAKQYAMTRGNEGTYVVIDQGNELTATFYVNKSEAETETISSRKVTAKYGVGADYTAATSDFSQLYVTFDKGSGACKVFSTGSYSDAPADSTVPRHIVITGGGSTYDVSVSGLTGRVDMERK